MNCLRGDDLLELDTCALRRFLDGTPNIAVVVRLENKPGANLQTAYLKMPRGGARRFERQAA